MSSSFSRSGQYLLGLQAPLSEVPLPAILELVHSSSQTGRLTIRAEVGRATLPLDLCFFRGEVVSACILDWEGLDALYSFPQDAASGEVEFRCEPVAAGTPLAPFQNLLGEWARLSDEWPRYCEQLLSPAQRFQGEAAPFSRPEGASAHWVAAETGQPLHEVAAQMAALRQIGFIQPLEQSFEWDTLVLPASEDAQALRQSPVVRLIDGERPLSHLLRRGLTPPEIRRELLTYLDTDGTSFPGSGRAVRDWLWEAQAQPPEGMQFDLRMS